MKRTSSLPFIFITILIDVLGIGLLYPILPNFIAQLSHQNLSTSSLHYGWLLSLYGAMQFFFAPLMGTLSDRFGRRPVLLLSMLFSGFDYVLMALAPNLIWLYIGRTISGITGASFTAASAYIADVSPPEKRSANFGIIGAAFGLGFIIGPALGGLLGQYGIRAPFWVAAALCFANFLYGWLILPESLAPENRRPFRLREANPLGALEVLGRYPVVWGLAGAYCFSNLAGYCINSTWALFTAVRFDWNPREIGLSLAAFGAMALFYQLGVARVLIPRWGDKRTILIGLTVGAIEYVAYGLSTQGWMIYFIMIAGGIGMLGSQALQGFLSQQVGEDEQGTLQGALTSLASLMGIFGPMIATGLFSFATREETGIYIPGAPFFLAGVLSAVALVITLRVLKHAPEREETRQAEATEPHVEAQLCTALPAACE